MQCGAAWCSVVPCCAMCVAVCCSVAQFGARGCSVLHFLERERQKRERERERGREGESERGRGRKKGVARGEEGEMKSGRGREKEKE